MHRNLGVLIKIETVTSVSKQGVLANPAPTGS